MDGAFKSGADSHARQQAGIPESGLAQPDLTEMYRRALFNILARNQDDHTKNIAFQMDRRGAWHLAPAYDLIYSYNPTGAWTHRHQMTLNGKRDDFSVADLLAAAKAANLKPPKAKSILKQVCQAVSQWKLHAATAEVAPDQAGEIWNNLRLDLRS